MKPNRRVGSRLDDFLREEKILDEARAMAVKRVLSFQMDRDERRSRLPRNAMVKTRTGSENLR